MPTTDLLLKSSSLLPESVKQRVKRALGVPGVEGSLRRMSDNGFAPKTVIDIGAYSGEWTRLCKEIFPDAHVLMVEPQSSKEAPLRQLTSELSGLSYSQSLLGETSKDAVGFYENESASSVLESDGHQEPTSTIPMRTLSEVTRNTEFSTPDFIKLDVQGYELSVLSGGEDVLNATEAVLMEVNLIDIYDRAPLLQDVVIFMGERSFRVYDICTFFRRPLDGALWQVDMIFLKGTSSLLESKRWS